MARTHNVSRRQMLAMSVAVARFAVGGSRHAVAQAAKRIERLDPALDQIIDPSEPIVDIATNLGGTPMSRGRCGGGRAAICCFGALTRSAGNIRPASRLQWSRRTP